MKYTALTAIACMHFFYVSAQQQGTIVYERKVDVHRRIEDEQMKATTPQFRTSKHILFFKDSISVYKAMPEDETPDPFENSGGTRMIIRMGPGENSVLYKNFSKLQIEEQTEFVDKQYIIDDTIRTQPWKLTDETKQIAGIICKKATATTETGNAITAWYAETITTPAGPENFSGLPGAILGMDMNSGEIVFTATAIQKEVNTKELKAPKDGKHITRADFQKKVEEVLGPVGPGGRRIIRM